MNFSIYSFYLNFLLLLRMRTNSKTAVSYIVSKNDVNDKQKYFEHIRNTKVSHVGIIKSFQIIPE